MNSLRIPSDNLLNLNGTVKTLVNQGVWFLYLKKKPSEDNRYILIADNNVFHLDRYGKITALSERSGIDKKIGKSVYFSDIPLPDSLVNMASRT